MVHAALPNRLVIDLPKTKFAIDPKELKARGLMANVRYGHINDKTSRLIIEAKGPFVVDKVDILPNEGSAGYRMVADISSASQRAFDRRWRCRRRQPARRRRRRKASDWG